LVMKPSNLGGKLMGSAPLVDYTLGPDDPHSTGTALRFDLSKPVGAIPGSSRLGRYVDLGGRGFNEKPGHRP
jgi:hypothetical protein